MSNQQPSKKRAFSKLIGQYILQAYPAASNQPIHLEEEEQDNPQAFINTFFENYTLIEIHTLFKTWLEDWLHYNESLPYDFLTSQQNIVKLIEALWIIHSKTD